MSANRPYIPSYTQELSKLIDFNYKWTTELLYRLVPYYIRSLEKSHQFEFSSEASPELYLDIRDTFEGKISVEELGKRVMDQAATYCHDTIKADFKNELVSRDQSENDDSELRLDNRDRAKDINSTIRRF